MEFERLVEGVRVGEIFAHDTRQYTRWRNQRRTTGQRSRGLTGAELEAAVMRIATVFPQNVVRGTA